jgi:integrase
LAWERVKRRAGVVDLRFHDLRHEAISRFFELGLSVPEVALISGHKDSRMLFRYTHLRATDVAKKLKAASPPPVNK